MNRFKIDIILVSYMKKSKNNKVATYLILTILSVLVIFPVFWMVSISFRPNIDVFKYPLQLLPNTPTIEAYEKVFHNPKIITYFVNSYLNSIIVTAVSTIFAIFAGYGISRYEFRGKRLFNTFVVGTQTIPSVTLIIPFFILMVTYKLYDTRTGLLLAYISFALPYTIVMMVGYYNSIPKSFDEAARIDGASDLQVMWRVIVPVARSGIMSTMLYTFVLSWNEYIFASTLVRNDALKTIPIGIALLKGEYSYEWNVLMAMSIVGSIPVLLFYLFGQKGFIAGLGEGGVKG